MVVQTTIKNSDETEKSYDVKVQLPGQESAVANGYEITQIGKHSRVKQFKKNWGSSASLILNIALIITVFILGIYIINLNKKLENMRNREDEIELKPQKMVDHEKSVDLSASVDDADHEKLHQMDRSYGANQWFGRVRLVLIITRTYDDCPDDYLLN
uniref:uncharacterized protein LOC120347619 n=1 Tax=Styela clava TaxID=7725 RepID=UPI0019397659|nr:uncharacterized protein LOC120347619 [Styela clava]